MRVLLFMALGVFIFAQSMRAQSFKEIANADGVSIVYKLTKTDSSGTKKDKYLLEVNVQNNNGYDLAYLIPKNSTFSLPLSDLMVTNTVNLFGMKLPEEYLSLSGFQTSLQTSDQKMVYVLPSKDSKKFEFKLITKKDIIPVVASASFKQRLISMENLY